MIVGHAAERAREAFFEFGTSKSLGAGEHPAIIRVYGFDISDAWLLYTQSRIDEDGVCYTTVRIHLRREPSRIVRVPPCCLSEAIAGLHSDTVRPRDTSKN